MVTEEQRLCRRAQSGDRGAASALLKMFYRQVFSHQRRLCGNEQVAEDLTQETFVKIWSSLKSYRGKSSFRTLIYTIAYRVYLDWLRKEGRLEGLRNEWWSEHIDASPGPFEIAADRQMAQRLYKAVDQLDENKRQVVHLHYYQGLTLRETAQVLNVAISTVKYRLRVVMKVLRSKMS